MSKESRLRETIDKEHVKSAQTLLKSAPLSYLLFTTRQLSFKKYLLFTCQILGLFPNRLAANDKYSVLNSYKLMMPIKIQLYEKAKIFSESFSGFSELWFKFWTFWKKSWPS